MSEFLEKAQKKGRIKPLKEAFIEYPVEEEYHQGKVENILCVQEESSEYYLYSEGDIVFVSEYVYENGETGGNHLFVIIEKNIGIPIEYLGMLISSHLSKLRFETNEYLPKNKENNLDKDSIVKIDVLYKINQDNILFKIGSVDKQRLEEYKKKYLEL